MIDEKLRSKIVSYLQRAGSSISDAEDSTQETLVSLFTHPPKNFTWSYVKAVAFRKWVSKKRKDNKYRKLEFDIEEYQQPCDNGLLLSCLNRLPDVHRKALVGHFWQDLTRRQGAAKYGITENGYRNKIQRAKAKLRDAIKREKKRCGNF